jgi:hypothetical protein
MHNMTTNKIVPIFLTSTKEDIALQCDHSRHFGRQNIVRLEGSSQTEAIFKWQNCCNVIGKNYWLLTVAVARAFDDTRPT